MFIKTSSGSALAPHSALTRTLLVGWVIIELNRFWYSVEVMKEQTIACCLPVSRGGPLLTLPTQKRKPSNVRVF
jgi:hypothetical protein